MFAVLLSTLSLLRLNLGANELDGKLASELDSNASLVEAVIPARRMHCESCARKITERLSKLDGVRTVAPDASRKEVFVAFNPERMSEDRLCDELTELGFR